MMIPREALEVRHVASTDQTRHTLNGVLFSENCTTATATATDGRSLLSATWTMLDENDYPAVSGDNLAKDGTKQAIISVDTLAKVARSIPKKSTLPILEQVKATMTKNIMQFVTTNLEAASILPSRIIDGDFPNYEQVLPKEEDIKLRVLLSVEQLEKTIATLRKMGLEKVEFGFMENGLGPISIKGKTSTLTVVGAIMPMSK